MTARQLFEVAAPLTVVVLVVTVTIELIAIWSAGSLVDRYR